MPSAGGGCRPGSRPESHVVIRAGARRHSTELDDFVENIFGNAGDHGREPIALTREFIERLTREGDVVYDPFMGRGTTVIDRSTYREPALPPRGIRHVIVNGGEPQNPLIPTNTNETNGGRIWAKPQY